MVDRFDRALAHTRTAIDAILRIDIELPVVAVKALARADDNAVRELAITAGFGHDVGHRHTTFRVGK
jgi:hypothetical protein